MAQGSVAFTEEDIYKLIETVRSFDIEICGDCFTCGKPVTIKIKISPDDGAYSIEGGAVWKRDRVISSGTETTLTLKCDDCFAIDSMLHDVPTEVFARVVGYMRPVDGWNLGKKEEFNDRKGFKIRKGE
jgi:hypothetical protein